VVAGGDIIASFAAEPVHRYIPAWANGQAASAAYRWDERKASYVAEALEVLTLDGASIKAMTAFMMPELFSLFRLPDEIGRAPARR
jgi:hypothetical protein